MSASHQAAAPHDEADLMVALGRGDLSALGELYDRHADNVRRFALRVTGRREEAEDVTQDAFVALVEAAKRYDPAHPVRPFVIGIAGKLVLRRRRRAAIALRVLADVRAWLSSDDAPTPEAVVSAQDQLARYQRALSQLSDAKRVTVIMSDIEGMRGPEIAEALDIPVRTVWTRLHHARAELRHALGMEKTR